MTLSTSSTSLISLASTVRVCVMLVTASGAFGASAAYAQTPPPFTAGYQDGFTIQSADGDNRLVIGMVAQVDGRFSLDDPTPITNTFSVRKLRPTFTGRVGKYFDFKVMPDFGNGTTSVQDMYFDTRFSPKFRVRMGKDKTPVGYELIQGDGNLWFPERSQASNLVPNRDIGVQVQGDLLANNKLFYAGGVFNGVPDGSSSTTEVDTNGSKDLAGRIVLQPFRSSATPASTVSGLGFQIGGSTGKQIGALPSFKTSVGQVYFSYAAGAAASGVRNRVSPAVFFFYKRFGTFAEFMQSTQAVTRAGVETDVSNHGWDVSASLFLTGEAASYGLIRPKIPFDPAKGQWGAVQILGRYTQLAVDQQAFDQGLAAATASRDAKSFTVAMNWYPVTQIKYYVTYERTMFDGGASRPAENVILFRMQLAF